MSYNNKYKTRNSGRFNAPGQFVSTGYSQHQQYQQQSPQYQQQPPQYQQQPPQYQNQPEPQEPEPVPSPPQLPPPLDADEDEPMKSEPDDEAENKRTEVRPPWMRRVLAGGVKKKVSNQERRRRQNNQLRRLLSPKNAVMVLNELLPLEDVNAMFRVEAVGAPPTGSFCAALTIDGTTYRGLGENKTVARVAAAEPAVRDLVLRRLARRAQAALMPAPVAPPDGPAGAGADVEPLPMIQLASYALHKLFAEWEGSGHKVPPLRATAAAAASAAPAATAEGEASEPMSEGGAAGVGAGAGAGAPAPAPAPRALPANAAQMHPCSLLAQMRPGLQWTLLATDGDRPQNISYTMGVQVDNQTFIGKAGKKKEARRLAARAACEEVLGVRFAAE